MSSPSDQANNQLGVSTRLDAILEAMHVLTTRLATLEERSQPQAPTPTQPLGTHYEVGNASNESS